jgi:putative ABC transport system substrate-binding protein
MLTMITRLSHLFVVLLVSVVLGGAAAAAEPVKIGALNEGWGPTPAIVGLRDGLKALGYSEGEQFVIGTRFTQGNSKSLPIAVQELLKAGSDILFASGMNPAKAAQAATTSVPIVFAEVVADPVGLGLVQSIARPGGNITGVTDLSDELGPKRLQIFKEMLPSLKRVIFVYDPSTTGIAEALRQNREATRQLGITLVERPVRSEAEVRAAVAAVRKGEDGLIPGSSMSFNVPGFVLDATSQHRVPTIFNGSFWPERGALASYGPDFYESGRQAARLMDKIIKGQKPASIPVETNSRIDLVINLKVAKALGVSIAPTVVQRATRIIE